MSGSCSSPPLPWKKSASRPVFAMMKARVVSPRVNASRNVCDRCGEASVICKLCSYCVELCSILLDQFRYETRPSCLMAGADAGAVVTMEILMEGDQITPVRIILKFLFVAENRPSLIGVEQKNSH